jgi:hypothetical protein
MYTKMVNHTFACEEYSVPENIREHIDFITPTVHFDANLNKPVKRSTHSPVQPGKTKSVGSVTSNIAAPKTDGKISFGEITAELKQCDTYITPDCLRALYLFPPNFPEYPGSESCLVTDPCLIAISVPIALIVPVVFLSQLAFHFLPHVRKTG